MDSSVEQSGLKVDWPIGLCAEDLGRYGDSVLSDREREALSLRFGVDGAAPKTLREVGDCLGVGLERARQVIDAATTRLSREKHGRGIVSSMQEPRLRNARKIASTRFGQDLRAFRKNRHFTQARLSARTAIPLIVIRNLESGEREIDLITVVKLASALEVTVDELLRSFSWRVPGDSDFGAFSVQAEEVWP